MGIVELITENVFLLYCTRTKSRLQILICSFSTILKGLRGGRTRRVRGSERAGGGGVGGGGGRGLYFPHETI